MIYKVYANGFCIHVGDDLDVAECIAEDLNKEGFESQILREEINNDDGISMEQSGTRAE